MRVGVLGNVSAGKERSSGLCVIRPLPYPPKGGARNEIIAFVKDHPGTRTTITKRIGTKRNQDFKLPILRSPHTSSSGPKITPSMLPP